jgi:hypothetical protein
MTRLTAPAYRSLHSKFRQLFVDDFCSMKTISRFLLLLVVSLALGTCTATQEASSDDDGEGSPNLITAKEIQATGSTNVLAVVRDLRPSWLRKRGGNSTRGDVVVYYDGANYGGPNSLSRINVQSISEIKYLGAARANARYGTGHQHGAILVVSE